MLGLLVSDKNSMTTREKKGQREWDSPSGALPRPRLCRRGSRVAVGTVLATTCGVMCCQEAFLCRKFGIC